MQKDIVTVGPVVFPIRTEPDLISPSKAMKTEHSRSERMTFPTPIADNRAKLWCTLQSHHLPESLANVKSPTLSPFLTL